MAAPTSCPEDGKVEHAARGRRQDRERHRRKAFGRLATLLLPLAVMALACSPSISSAQTIQRITSAGQDEMLADPGTDVVGASNADVTIIEFLDYNCPYCRRFAPTLQALIAEDHKIAVVYKDWPILGDVSVYAARSALAARWQGKYVAAHDALLNGSRLTQDNQVDLALSHAGIDLNALRLAQTSHARDIDALLARNDAEAHALHLRGTPGIVIGRELLPGIVDLNGLKQLVADSRHDLKSN